ncbi:SDR family NAD(P)-dependent oxidoreductase [Streptosporangiaceae bacterium NEAU-GS5]|nr:SDR family NAD(P)-dependent oxidoreductase [Streptosporangiaceae bacterium NEAU-GS5]
MTRLSSTVIMVVGATSGIGRAVALRLAAEGAMAVAAGRRAELGESLVAEIVHYGGQAVFLPCDATEEDDVAAAVGTTVSTFGRLDGAVNNASTAAVSAIPGLAAYTAAKHGVAGLTRSAALEWADRGVRVNALVTGNVDTPLYRRLLGAPPQCDRARRAAY